MRDSLENLVIAAPSRTHMEFPQQVADHLGKYTDLVDVMDPKLFSSGEFGPVFIFNGQKGLEGKTVYLIVSQGPFVTAQELAARTGIAADAAKYWGAKKVVVVSPDLAYSRADRGFKEDPDKKLKGKGVTSAWQARLYQISGVDQVLTMHLHNKRLYDIYAEAFGVDNGRKVLQSICPSAVLAHYLMKRSSLSPVHEGENIVFVSCDEGCRGFVEATRKATGLVNSGILYLDKGREADNNPDAIIIDNPRLEGTDTLEGKTLIVPDDILDTGGTIINVMKWLWVTNPELSHNLGIPKDAFLYATHAVMAGKAYADIQERIAKQLPMVKEFIVTDTRPYIADLRDHRFKEKSTVLRMARLFGDAILKIHNAESPEEAYKFDSFDELDRVMSPLYDIKRSSRHFLNMKK